MMIMHGMTIYGCGMDELEQSYCYCKLDGHTNEDLVVHVN
jgi:hypothetical protein